jgi:solute carrier family 25 carnitine/acylcarnitine transporter 20/29
MNLHIRDMTLYHHVVTCMYVLLVDIFSLLSTGALAGVAYWTAFYPADTIKSHIQTNPLHANQSFVQIFRRVYKTEGINGLYRGWGITAARAAPAHAAIFATYEYSLKLLKNDK